MLKYLVMYDHLIRSVDVASETTCFYTRSDGIRFKKDTDYAKLFDTFVEAKYFSVARLDQKILSAEKVVSNLKDARNRTLLQEPLE